jgi:hypothetical protein
MEFTGAQLELIVSRQRRPLVVLNSSRQTERIYENPADAHSFLKLGGYIGIGHPNRIRYVLPIDTEHHRVPWASRGETAALMAHERRGRLPDVWARGGRGTLGRAMNDGTLHLPDDDRRRVYIDSSLPAPPHIKCEHPPLPDDKKTLAEIGRRLRTNVPILPASETPVVNSSHGFVDPEINELAPPNESTGTNENRDVIYGRFGRVARDGSFEVLQRP